MNVTTLNINGRPAKVAIEPEKPLLWVLREDLALTGAKYGCGVGVCKSCTVLLDGKPVQSCTLEVGEIGERQVTTIEGLGGDGRHPVQTAWIAAQVPQCGYCQPGFIMATVGLLATTPRPTDAQIDEALDNVCRCGTYPRIRTAIRALVAEAAGTKALETANG